MRFIVAIFGLTAALTAAAAVEPGFSLLQREPGFKVRWYPATLRIFTFALLVRSNSVLTKL